MEADESYFGGLNESSLKSIDDLTNCASDLSRAIDALRTAIGPQSPIVPLFYQAIEQGKREIEGILQNKYPGFNKAAISADDRALISYSSDAEVLVVHIHSILVSLFSPSQQNELCSGRWPSIMSPLQSNWKKEANSYILTYPSSPFNLKIDVKGGGSTLVVNFIPQSSSSSSLSSSSTSAAPPPPAVYLSVKDYVTQSSNTSLSANKTPRGVKPASLSKLQGIVREQIATAFPNPLLHPRDQGKAVSASTALQGSQKQSLQIGETMYAEPSSLEESQSKRRDDEGPKIPSSLNIQPEINRQPRPMGDFGLIINQPRRGDFSGDLFPNFSDPFGGFGSSDQGSGMLMGPGHPAFTGGPHPMVPPGVPPGARFDPYGPFVPSPSVPFGGVPQPKPFGDQKKDGKKKPPPGGDYTTGDPDPDDFPPPGYIS